MPDIHSTGCRGIIVTGCGKKIKTPLGIGTDIEDISRFRDPEIRMNRTFLERVFTQDELAYCFSKRNPAPHLAARFCGKEAVIKALQEAGYEKTGMSSIEILNNPDGVPFARIDKKEFNDITIKISLSHCRDKCLAFAIVFRGSL